MLPTPYAVGVKRFIPDATDPRGNPVKKWAETPVDWPVHEIAPGVIDEPGKEDRDLSLEWYTLLGPNGHENEPAVMDRIVLPGKAGRDFDVDGVPKDFSQGPWRWAAGVQVLVKRAEG